MVLERLNWGWPRWMDAELEQAFAWRDLADTELRPIAEAGEEFRVNRALVRALGEHDLLTGLFPAPSGDAGPNVSAVRLCLLKEFLGQRSTAAEDALGLQGLGFYPIYRWGSPEQVDRWYDPVTSGRAVAAFAMSEPEAGSDAGALDMRAVRDGDGWRLSGTKIWISNAPDADVYVVFARTADGASRTGITAFVVDGDAEGLHGEPIDLIVSHPVGRLDFDGVRVSDDAIVGAAGRGWAIGLDTLYLFRMSVGAFALGVAQAALEATIAHVSERRQFGKPLAALQTISHRLAECVARLAASRLLVYHAARAFDEGDPVIQLGAMAKMRATETAQQIVDICVQLHGARALEQGHLLGHLYKEVRAPRIYEGTTEVLREVVARQLFPAPA